MTPAIETVTAPPPPRPAHPPLPGAGPASDPASVVGRIARSGLWSMLGHASTAASAFIVSIIVARTLGPARFGQYSYYLWLARLLPTLLALGVPAAITKLVAERLGKGEPGEARALIRLGFRLHVAIVPLAMTASGFAVWHSQRHVILGLGIAAGVAFGLLSLDLEGLLVAVRRFHVLGTVATVGAVGQIGLALVCALLHASWQTYVIMQVGVLGLGVGVYTWLARAEIFARDVTRLGRRDRQAFVRFSGIMCFAVLIDAVIWGRPELIFLARYRPQADLGLYSAALRLASIATIVPIVASRALLPEFARLRGADDHDGLAHVYPRVCRLLAVIAAPLALGGAAVAAPLVGIMYGHRYDGAATTAALLLAGSLVNALTGPASAAVLTGPRPRLVAELGSIAAVVNIVADFVLIPRYGIVGAAGINVVIQAASVATGITYSWWKLGLRYPVRPVVRIIAIAGIAALGAGFVARAEPGWPGLIIGTLVAVALYAGLLAGTKTVTGDELSGLVRSWRRGGDSDGSGSEVQQAQSTNRSLSTRRVDQ